MAEIILCRSVDGPALKYNCPVFRKFQPDPTDTEANGKPAPPVVSSIFTEKDPDVDVEDGKFGTQFSNKL